MLKKKNWMSENLKNRELKELAGKYGDVIIQHIFLNRLPEIQQQVLLTVGDGQSLQKLSDAADKIADVMPKETTINHMHAPEPYFLRKTNSTKYENI